MATGDITCTYIGEAAIGNSGAIVSLLTGVNVGAATAGTETASIITIPAANGLVVRFFKIARSA